MKQFVIIVLCVVFAGSMAYAQNKDSKKKNAKETVTFVVDGMDCANCVKKIEKNISFEKGVTDLKCDLSTRTAEITYRSDKTTEDNLVSAFKKIGMEAKTVEEGGNAPGKEAHQHNH